MAYTIKEIFYTLQGEGANTGRPAVFCRFAGCNLWSGREEDRRQAICQLCDTDFLGTDGPGGGRFPSAEDVARAVMALWPAGRFTSARPLVVFTGGEPLLQLDAPLATLLHDRGFEVAIETNGTRLPPPGVDWVCMSPKAGTELALRRGQELKLVFPQKGAEPDRFERFDFRFFFLQPMDGPERETNTRLAVQYCLEHPWWRLSLQTQKYLGIP
jgi:7-carboxy-7-deazaguanine synthase (Cx14CxxC type)